MAEMLMRKLRSSFVKVWLAGLLLIVLFLGAQYFLIGQRTPGLRDVLAREKIRPSHNMSVFIASLLAVSLASISLAKGYEVVKRTRSFASVVLPEEEPETSSLSYDKEINEIKQSNERLLFENDSLRSRLRGIETEMKEGSDIKHMLSKSNVSLSKECQRLKSENETLLLKVNSFKGRSKRRIGEVKIAKAKGKSSFAKGSRKA